MAYPHLERGVRVIDRFAELSGVAIAWLMVPLMGAVVYEVIARYAFAAPTLWAFDVTYMLYGAMFMLGAAYALLVEMLVFREVHPLRDLPRILVHAATLVGSVLILLGVGSGDDEVATDRLARQVAELRIFADETGRTNRSLLDVRGGALVVSQFTLLADTTKGNRPSFSQAAAPKRAEPLYEAFCAALEAEGVRVSRGMFGARMDIEIVNDGPVTIVLGT